MTRFMNRLRARIRNRGFDDELAEELRFHEEMKRRELEAAGLKGADARAAARRALGNTTLMREASRSVWIAPWLESIVQDLRYAVRTLVRQPAHSATAAAVLVVAIGLNTSLFTFFKATALQPWPGRDPDRLVQIRGMQQDQVIAPSMDEYRFIRQHSTSFSGVAASLYGPGLLRTDGQGEIGVQGTWVSANFFDVLGARILVGRGFVEADEHPAEQAAVVLSDHFWRSYFSADPGVIGRTISINRRPFTVIGILEPGVDGLANPVDVWGPLPHAPLETLPPDACCVSVIGRLAEGLDDARARAEVQTLHDRFGAASRRKTGQVQVFGTAYVSRPGQSDLDVIGAVGLALLLVLLLACANVGNLQLARGFARRRELATRLAIGASRARIIRQLLIESLVLSLAAGAVAIVIAAVLPQAVLSLLGQEIPPTRVSRFRPDWPVFAFTGTVCVIACVAFGLAPALRSTHTTIPLGSMDRHSTRRLRLGLRSVLLAAQIATCTALLAAAGLVTRAIVHVMSFDPGFRTEDLLRVSAFLPSDTPDERERTFLRQLLAALERDAPDRIAVSSPSPILSDGHARIFVMRVLLGNQSAASPHVVQRRSVSRNFFEVLGIPLLKGRVFASDATGELIVNEAFARMYFAGEDPVGRPIREIDRKGGVAASHTIVGVVGDVYLSGVERIEPLVFRPTTMGTFLTRGGPAAVERIRTAALGLNAAATVRAWPIRDDLSADLEASRQGAAVAWAIGLLGLLLATVGVFGVFAYAVEERRREIGVRLALGAARAQIVRTMISTSGRAIAAGLALGILLSFACGPVLRSYLYGLSPLDPVAYGLVLALLAAAGLCATVVPARRACRVDPAVTLRED